MDVDALRKKTIKDFEAFLAKVKKGYKPNYDIILDEIDYIELDKYNPSMYQYYINNKWKL